MECGRMAMFECKVTYNFNNNKPCKFTAVDVFKMLDHIKRDHPEKMALSRMFATDLLYDIKRD